MTEIINVYKLGKNFASVKQTPLKRDWMDSTWEKHAYHCFPVSLANTLGYSISFSEEISFIWDGILDSSSDHVEILSGTNTAYSGRGSGTVSFKTGLVFETSPNITLLQMPVPNFFVDGVQVFTTLLSSSFLKLEMPLALRVTRPNQLITIPANQPIATVVPIPLKQISDIEMNIYSGQYSEKFIKEMKEYGEEAQKLNRDGQWTDWYRNATNHKGESVGSHELKSIKLAINDYSKEERRVIA